MLINNFLTMTNTPYKYGKKSGPPPKRGPNPQGITVKDAKRVLRKSKRNK